MKKIAAIIFIITICLGSLSSAKEKKFAVSSFTLKNGMQVIVIPNTKVSAVSHMVWYKVGALDEPLGKSGIAHFLEHLMFKGTHRYAKGEFSKIIAKAGGDDNAFTGADYTAYFQNISRDKLELVMDMESDRMQNLIFDEEEALKERDVILEERSSRVDNKPISLLQEQMKAVLYLNHPYKNPLIGWRHEIEGLTVDDAIKWYQTYYAPNNAILIVSGDITEQELRPLAEKYYGKIKAKDKPERKIIKEPKHISPINISLSDETVTKTQWVRYYLAPSQNTKDSDLCYALIVLSYILGGGDTSRLYQNMVVESPVAAAAGSYYDDLQIGESIFGIYATPTNDSGADKVRSAIEKEIQKIKTHSITSEELERAKKAIIAEAIYEKEDLKTLAYLYGQIVATGIDISYAENWENNINSVTLEQTKQAANLVLKPENSVTGVLLKKNR